MEIGIDSFAAAPHSNSQNRVLDNSIGAWVAPVSKPIEPEGYVAVWDEQDQQWNLVLQQT